MAQNAVELMDKKITITRKRVYSAIGILFLATASFFTYSYLASGNITGTGGKIETVTTRPSQAPSFKRQIYGSFGGGELAKPMAVTVVAGKIYVTDTLNYRVQMFSADGEPLAMFGKRGTGLGQFSFPYGIAGDKNGNIYVADLYNGTISVFDHQGVFLRNFLEQTVFNKTPISPAGLAIDGDKLYMTDVKRCQVIVFNLKGRLILTIGKPGVKEGQFVAPNGVAVDRNGDIYVTDSVNQRIQVFNAEGKFKRIINGSILNPRGIGITKDGTIYVVSNLTHSIYGFNKEGENLFSFGELGDQEEDFALPNGLFVDAEGTIYITDTMNQRISVYR